jgi:hypothetical protein
LHIVHKVLTGNGAINSECFDLGKVELRAYLNEVLLLKLGQCEFCARINNVG